MRISNFFHRKPRQPISIRRRLIMHMTILTLIVLAMTWLLQVCFLDFFYESTKRNELRRGANTIASNINNAELETIARNIAIDGSMGVFVYELSATSKTAIIHTDPTGGMAGRPEYFGIDQLIDRAEENNGLYIGKYEFGGKEIHNEPFPFLPFDGDPEEETPEKERTKRLICVKLTENAKGDTCLILLNAALLPLGSTVDTLELQFIWLAIALIVISMISVFVLYRRISTPLIRMTESAKQLAVGRYDTVFVGTGYRETHELADTLNYAATELSRVDRLQKELIANISHDLRTPLTMIKGYSELMRDIPDENTPENMQVVIDETERLSELVNSLLDLSMLQSGSTQPTLAPFNLTNTVRDSITRYDALVRHRGYRIDFLSDRDVWVGADRKLIVQVLYNLINNAINYTGADKSVSVIQTVKEQSVRISICDTGEGIDPEQMPLIWDRYYKVDKVHRRAMVGTGLGLSIVKGILEKHNAIYGVSSTKGEGSTFWFELPILPNVSETTDPILPPPQSEE